MYTGRRYTILIYIRYLLQCMMCEHIMDSKIGKTCML